MIRAQAIVDEIDKPPGNGWGQGHYRVTVWGQPPHEHRRVYEIRAKSDSIAAHEGIARFVAAAEREAITQD